MTLVLDIIGIIANVINIIYNIPMVYTPFKNRSVTNISLTFMLLRLLGIVLWLVYSFLLFDIWYIVLICVSFISSIILLIFYMLQHFNKCGWTNKKEIV